MMKADPAVAGTGWSIINNKFQVKERRRIEQGGEKKKRIEAQRAKPSTSTSAIGTLIGDEEQAGKKKGEQRNREQVSSQATLDPPVASYDPQGSYGEYSCNTPSPQGE